MTAPTLTPEARAIRLLLAGDSHRDVALVTGLTVDEVRQLHAEMPRPAVRPPSAPVACPEPNCGEPQSGPVRPRKGWVQIKPAAGLARWFCGWACARRHAQTKEHAA